MNISFLEELNTPAISLAPPNTGRKQSIADGSLVLSAEQVRRLRNLVRDLQTLLDGVPVQTVEGQSIPHDIHVIQSTTASFFSLTLGQMLCASRLEPICWPRHQAIHFTLCLTRHSRSVVALAFGGRDRATVQHASNRVLNRIQTEPQAKRQHADLSAKIEVALAEMKREAV